MSMITTKDGVQIFYKDGAMANPSSSTTAGRSAPTTGTPRCSFSSSMGTALWESIAAATDARARCRTAMIWTTTPLTPLQASMPSSVASLRWRQQRFVSIPQSGLRHYDIRILVRIAGLLSLLHSSLWTAGT